MIQSEKEIFEKVLNECEFTVKSEYNGLYFLTRNDSVNASTIQTNGYNLLESLRRLVECDLSVEALR